jgi:hypothetical protein
MPTLEDLYPEMPHLALSPCILNPLEVEYLNHEPIYATE